MSETTKPPGGVERRSGLGHNASLFDVLQADLGELEVRVSVPMLQAALRTLRGQGYAWTDGAELWKPPLGNVTPIGKERVPLRDATVQELAEALVARGGTWAQVGRAMLLVLRKSEDYNKSQLTGDAAGDGADRRDVYFPLGHASYAQMIHVKSQRVLALVDAELKGRPTNFEGLRDTALDLINYASFLAERLEREKGSGD